MKVLHLHHYPQIIGGAEKLVLKIMTQLKQERVENIFVHETDSDTGELLRVCSSYGFAGLSGRGKKAYKEALQALGTLIEKERPDVIHLHSVSRPETIFFCKSMAPTLCSLYDNHFYCPGEAKFLETKNKVCDRAFGPGCLVSAFTTHCNSIRPNILIERYLRTQALLKSERMPELLVLSSYQKKCLIQNGFSEGQIRVLAPFIDEGDLKGFEREKTVPGRILFCGRIVKPKGLCFLLEALKLVKSSFHLSVDGAGPDLDRVRQRAIKLGLSDKIHFQGWLAPEAHRKEFQKAAVVVVPSVWPEPFGLVGLEAMNNEKPVIAFNVGGISSWLEDGKTGFLVPEGNLKAMSEKIDFLLGNDDKRTAMGKAGREAFQERFSKEVYLKELLSVYEKVIDEGSDKNNQKAFNKAAEL